MDHRTKYRGIIKNLLQVMPIELACDNFNHNKPDQHEWTEECKPQLRYQLAMERAQKFLDEDIKNKLRR